MLELTARTDPGRRLVASAEGLASDLARCAPLHDRLATYPHGGIAGLRANRWFAAPIPEELGGLGVESVHDLVVASSRLARGDASLAIGVNMHLLILLNVVRRWRMARAAGQARRENVFAASMTAVARDGVIMAAAGSEIGQDLTRPATTATRTPDGWRVDGHKIFCTMSPAATLLVTAVRYTDGDGDERFGYAQVPSGAPGVLVHDDWDGLGMRASGSHSVTFDGVQLPASALAGGFRAGDAVAYMERHLAAGLFHAAASLGVAESAHATALDGVARRGQSGDGWTRTLLADSAVELAACRATLERASYLVDEHAALHPADAGPDEAIVAVFTETQAAKTFVTGVAQRVVDRAMTLSGGSGYRFGHDLARAYRDVRAGAFMHPLGANRAHDLIARVSLGLDPSLS
jgi:alkylation response protein AidB-like acyl-CoA dehydrogenase